jgi:uncharacterized protein (TIGR02680 family)
MTSPHEHRTPLPFPGLPRWQPLRLGVVNLYHYDSEEFWFCDGHLLLRGNNGTGKSKVLSLTLPFLLDAQVKPSRIEPDGDPGKKMAWNLLMDKHDRRMGYTWIEFGRVDEQGEPRYLTLGCGLYAVTGRPQPDNWFFLVEVDRIGQELWLTSPQRVVLTKEKLKDALTGRGQVFPNHEAYRRAVDARLFQLGSLRYAALMDTLVQLRQPQLSKKPDETSLSNALTEALPPLASDLLGDVSDALNQLEEDRRQLDEFERLAGAVGGFNTRYSVYAAVHSRRQAQVLRSAQTGFENASKDLNAARAALETERDRERRAAEHAEHAELEAQHFRARHEELLSDPAMQDATRIDNLRRELGVKSADVGKAEKACTQANDRLRTEQAATAARHSRLVEARRHLDEVRAQQIASALDAGIEAGTAPSILMTGSEAQLNALGQGAFNDACNALRSLGQGRREQIRLIQQRIVEAAQAQHHHDTQLEFLDAVRSEAEEAILRHEQAEAEVDSQTSLLVTHWQSYLDGLLQLRVGDPQPIMDGLTAWLRAPGTTNPATAVLLKAQQEAIERLANAKADIARTRQALQAEQDDLEAERQRLQAGEDASPPTSPYRSPGARKEREGAPFWQLVEFDDALAPSERAGLEAALESSGILDAWVTPEGMLHEADGVAMAQQPTHDARVLSRPPVHASLAGWLRPAGTAMPVAARVVAELLRGVSCSPQDDGSAETWVSPTGHYRLGALAGSWSKPAAVFIGFAAREAARKQRLEDIALRMAELLVALETNRMLREENEHDTRQASKEWELAPPDSTLRDAHAAAGAIARHLKETRARVERADETYREASRRLKYARNQLTQDAADLHLPMSKDGLATIDSALGTFMDRLSQLFAAVPDLLTSHIEHQSQLEREAKAREATVEAQQELSERRQQANDCQARLDVLLESVGVKVEEVHKKLKDARDRMAAAEAASKQANKDKTNAGEARVRCEVAAARFESTFLAAVEKRQTAVDHLQQFARTGLVAVAVPEAELPDMRTPWTIEPALTLARRVEQALATVNHDDQAWHRIQQQISQDLTELQRALGALHHQAQAETSDHGLIVSIVYQNRLMRPDQLTRHLVEEIAQRRELLSAQEREVLENHLQAEIAAAVQHLMREAVRQVDAINAELERRPTSTGVKFRLQWRPLAEGAEGAPVGLEAARKRLLNTSSDLWSPEDRRVVGAMLQQRIAAERERGDATGGGSMLDQLGRALDYRRWHHFAVQRWQDGQWRKLSGPASSGERALGLTVPLFAAVASFYSHSNSTLAPRLVLLDEAFAGIDVDARAHCMGLIKEFDLDFVITSEQEWACYAALPGVSICQLQRRPGIDAVHISRWTWNGKIKKAERDPERRFPGATT